MNCFLTIIFLLLKIGLQKKISCPKIMFINRDFALIRETIQYFTLWILVIYLIQKFWLQHVILIYFTFTQKAKAQIFACGGRNLSTQGKYWPWTGEQYPATCIMFDLIFLEWNGLLKFSGKVVTSLTCCFTVWSSLLKKKKALNNCQSIKQIKHYI